MKNLDFLRKAVFTLLLLPAIIWVGKTQTITGDWNGVLDLEGISLQIVLHIKQVENGFQATMDSPDQDAFDIPLDTLTLESGKLEFIFNSAGAKYAGIVDESFTNIKGTFSQGGQDLPLAFQRGKIKPPENSITYIKEIYTKKEVYIPMRDGVRLFTSIYTPNYTTQLHPVLMNRTPYNAESSEDGFNFFLLAFIDYVKEGYIFVFQDVRGKYMSEGE
ncbi:MAG: hypothetical protein HQ543_00265, partial [Bacteroidetes bacterium]|nr:hypothetical protein [Bacteroidota bacterium]